MKLDGKSVDDLVAMRQEIEKEPSNRNPPGSLFIFTKKARKKLDAIDLAIADAIRQLRLSRGEIIDNSGYSGRQTNKR